MNNKNSLRKMNEKATVYSEKASNVPFSPKKVGHHIYFYSEQAIKENKKYDLYFNSSGLSTSGYYFEDEAYFLHGPYETKDQAEKALGKYASDLYSLLEKDGDV